jgi:hypothetical protein
MARRGLPHFSIPAAQKMDQDPNFPPALLHFHALRRVLESTVFHKLQKHRRVVAPGVGENCLAARCEQLGDEARQGGDVPGLVEHVGGDNEVEGSEVLRVRRVPVEVRNLRLSVELGEGVVERKIEGCLVVVGSEDLRACVEGNDGG